MAEKEAKNFNRSDRLSNERTYLAWIRTNLGLMAFGFVVERFSLFIEQIALVLAKSDSSNAEQISPKLQGYSSIFGICLVGLGAILCIFSYLKFIKIEKQINQNTYKSTLIMDSILMVIVFLTGLALLIYLINSHVVKIHN